MTNYLKNAMEPGPQTEKAHPAQVQNSAGGFSFAVDDWTRLDRFLVLGTEGGSYYAKERELTRENAAVIERLASSKDTGYRLIQRIAQISDSGRAPKNDPAIFALALAARSPVEEVRSYAYHALPQVCRIGTHLFHFAAFMKTLGSKFPSGFRRGVSRWYNEKAASQLALQLAKYQARDGWSHRDLLNLAHPTPKTADHDALYRWATYGYDECATQGMVLPPLIEAFEEAKVATTATQIVRLIRDYNLPRECIPTQWLNERSVWEALLVKMPMTAMIRNLATMTRVELLAPMSAAVATVTSRLSDGEALKQSRVHPLDMLRALLTYRSGHGQRGQNTWTPVQPICDALDAGFYAAFGNVPTSGKATLLALDVSGSMTAGTVGGVDGLTPRMASAAMALVTANVEPRYHLLGFSHRLVEVKISPKMRLDQAVDVIDAIPMGGTDCALPMIWATSQIAHGIKPEAFSVYTDNETYYGHVHPHVALQQYRQASGLPAKLAVVSLLANPFSIAAPDDAGMIDLVGFDAAAPALMADFFSGGQAAQKDQEDSE